MDRKFNTKIVENCNKFSKTALCCWVVAKRIKFGCTSNWTESFRLLRSVCMLQQQQRTKDESTWIIVSGDIPQKLPTILELLKLIWMKSSSLFRRLVEMRRWSHSYYVLQNLCSTIVWADVLRNYLKMLETASNTVFFLCRSAFIFAFASPRSCLKLKPFNFSTH